MQVSVRSDTGYGSIFHVRSVPLLQITAEDQLEVGNLSVWRFLLSGSLQASIRFFQPLLPPERLALPCG